MILKSGVVISGFQG
uniref:Uncharacterized protein n=1 Tax=Anguilla anguilla TaxID=7936 RepID=A0A0E9T5E0_ANGAN